MTRGTEKPELEVDPRIRVVHFHEAEEVGAREVLEFWRREGALPEEQARDRLSQLAFLALEEDGSIAATSTTFLGRVSQLRCSMWQFRTFVGEEHRLGDLARALLVATVRHLEGEFASSRNTRAPGLLIEIENAALRSYYNEAVWKANWLPGVEMPFVGENERGHHVRVSYFPGALAPLPAGGPVNR